MTPSTPQPDSLVEPTLAEDALLLLFLPDSGTIAGENTLFYVLGGAVLADLALRGLVQIADEAGRLETVGLTAPEDQLLRPAWMYVGDAPRRAQTVVAAVGPPLRAPVLERLVSRGDIERSQRQRLFLRSTRLAEGRTGRRDHLLAELRAVLVDGADPAPRVASLGALLSGSGCLHRLHPDIPWTSPVITRAAQLEQGDWGASAAGEAVSRAVTATIVNNIVVTMGVLPRS